MFVLAAAIKEGYSIDRLYELTKIDRWFLYKMRNMVQLQMCLEQLNTHQLTKQILIQAKQLGFSDKQIAQCIKSTELGVRNTRQENGRPDLTFIALT